MEEREKAIQEITENDKDKLEALHYDWSFWGRPKQLYPIDGNWIIWMILAGRGFGKTRTSSEAIKYVVKNNIYGRIGIIAPTAADARDTMIEGESGILSVFHPSERPKYEPSKRRITFPNGAICQVFSGDEPERLRGPQFEFLAIDELAAFKYPDDAFNNAMLGLRLGKKPRCIITTTPKPIPLIKELIKMKTVYLTTGSTYENFNNLAESYTETIISKYEGTRIGEQELHAKILGDTEGALWKRNLIERNRIKDEEMPDLVRIVIGVDPAVTNKKNSDETGIMICGIDENREGYVLQDRTIKGTPKEWAEVIIDAFDEWEADNVVAEVNQGGDLVKEVIHLIDNKIPIKTVHASKGKVARAEPVAALYEQDKVHHVGFFGSLEDQMTNWVVGTESPDRMDALVYSLTELMLGKKKKKVSMKGAKGLSKTSRWNL